MAPTASKLSRAAKGSREGGERGRRRGRRRRGKGGEGSGRGYEEEESHEQNLTSCFERSGESLRYFCSKFFDAPAVEEDRKAVLRRCSGDRRRHAGGSDSASWA